MANSNLLKIFKEVLRDKCSSRNNLSADNLAEESYYDSLNSETDNSNVEHETVTENFYIKSRKVTQPKRVGYPSENARHYKFCSLPDSKTDCPDMNIKVPEWSKVFKEILGNGASKAVEEQKEIKKSFKNVNYDQKKMDAIKNQHNDKKYSEIEFNINFDYQQTKKDPGKRYIYNKKFSESEVPREKREINRSYSYINKNRSNYIPENTQKVSQKKKEFIFSSSYRNKNISNHASQMIEAERKARELFAQAAILKPYTLKESLNDLAGCGVDVFKIGKCYNSPFVENTKNDSDTHAGGSTHFEIDVPLTGVVAKMKRLTNEDIREEPTVPFDEAWDDDLLF